MKGIWKPFSQVIGDERKYIAGRQLDLTKPLHSGNVEYDGEYITNREAVEVVCEKLNAEEGRR